MCFEGFIAPVLCAVRSSCVLKALLHMFWVLLDVSAFLRLYCICFGCCSAFLCFEGFTAYVLDAVRHFCVLKALLHCCYVLFGDPVF